MDGRRHSVDVPISKTLVALRRVRSLRDPSTNGISKLSPLIDNEHWENGISLRFVNATYVCESDDNGCLRSKDLDFKGHREHDIDSTTNFEMGCHMMNYCDKQQQDDELVYSNPKQQGDFGNKSPKESCCSNHEAVGLDLASIIPSSNHLKDKESCYLSSQLSSRLGRIDYKKSTRKLLQKNQAKPFELMQDNASSVDSPCLSASTQTPQDVDVLVDYNGCGISCCWSKSPRFRDANYYSEMEDLPLMLQHVNETDLHGQKSMRHIIGSEISPTLETPRSLSMKFRPKSFNDLVGQNMVGKSLSGAISRGRISSFYLFHGPRGTGKTSASRIFAAALNCISLEERRPCGLCSECVLFFSGRSKDVKEVDSLRINRPDKAKSLVKNACTTAPFSSRYKVFIIDECQLLNKETWATLLNSLGGFSQHVVFVMITPDLEKLPRSAVSRAQRYHFTKIKDADIASRLKRICVEEGLESEQDALDFIAAKSCGSLRDAEMMLDQLSLLGKKITISLVYELTGVISDDELLDLLDLSLSSDTSNTVIRARELLRSRIDPLQLISQLANLIMDILAGKCELTGSEIRRRFSDRHILAESSMQKLSHALRILSETEKQLRISKNQTTWFTAALLQLNSIEYSSVDANDSKLCIRAASNRDGDLCSTSSTAESLKHLTTGKCAEKSYKIEVQDDDKATLDCIWYKATEICESKRLKAFLRKQGKLSSVCINQGLAVVELEFHHRVYVARAEKSWKQIASSLQFILGCNIELRINHVPCTTDSKYARLKRSSFNFFNCSRRILRKSLSSDEQGCESDYADCTSQKPMMMDRTLSRSSDCGSRVPPLESYHGMELVTTLRSCEGNLLSSGKIILNRIDQETPRISFSRDDSVKEEECNYEDLASSTVDLENTHSNCFPRTLWLHKKLSSSYASKQKEFCFIHPQVQMY